MTERGTTETRKRKLPMGLASSSMVVSLLGVAVFVFLFLCVGVFLVALVMMLYGARAGYSYLFGIGFVLALASAVFVAFTVPVLVVVSGAQVFSLAGSVVALARSGKRSENGVAAPRATRAFAVIGVILSLFVMTVFVVGYWGYRNQQNHRRHGLDADYIVRVARYVAWYPVKPGEPMRFAPAMAAAGMNNSGMFETIMAVPTGGSRPRIIPPGAPRTDWPRYAAAVDAASDYRYVGGDLVRSPGLNAVASRVIILYDKESYDGGREVAFADEKRRWVTNGDLPGMFADASAARAGLGLPAITLDGPVPPAAP